MSCFSPNTELYNPHKDYVTEKEIKYFAELKNIKNNIDIWVKNFMRNN
jgi:hypothetical protein